MSRATGLGMNNLPIGSGDITGTPTGVDPSEDPTKNEYYAQRLQTPPWIQAGFPDYQSYAANLRLKEEQARALTQKQIDASAGASGASVTAARISTQGANDRAAVQAEIDRARNASDAAHQAAVDALAQGNADQARKEFAISSAELQRYHSLDAAIRQQEANTSATTAGYNVYKDLTDKASNPRNFMEQFFKNRGQSAPPGYSAYSNTQGGPQSIMPFDQFLPGFMRNIGLQGYGYGSASSGAGAATSPAASAPPPSGQNAQGQSWQPGQVNPYAGTNTNYGGSPTTADTALINGVKTWAGGAYSGQPVASSPSDAGDLTPYLKQGQAAGQARMMADGGSLHMTAPHAIVNLLSGKVAAIAGEQPGRGPQGFVPENAKFDGKAIIDPLKAGATGDPIPPDGTYTDPTIGKPVGDPISSYLPDTSTSPGVYAPPYDPNAAFPPDIRQPLTETTGAPITPPAPPPPQFTLTPELIAQARAAAATANSALPPGAVGGSVALPSSTATNPIPAPQPVTLPPPPTFFGPPITTPPPPVNTWGGPSYTNPTTLQSTPSGLGQNPQFLPEEAANVDPIVKEMIQRQTFPPFLQRLYAQAKGLPGLGTNVPQQTNLPPGVPLVSKLAYNQMSPSEQQGFASFLSAHGITLEDYLTLVEQASPQGGTSPANPAIPKFLSQGG